MSKAFADRTIKTYSETSYINLAKWSGILWISIETEFHKNYNSSKNDM